MSLRAAITALALVACNAFVPASVQTGAKVQVEETRADLMELAESMPGPPGFWCAMRAARGLPPTCTLPDPQRPMR